MGIVAAQGDDGDGGRLKGDMDRANRDLATAPSQTVRERVEELQRAIRETESRVNKATGK